MGNTTYTLTGRPEDHVSSTTLLNDMKYFISMHAQEHTGLKAKKLKANMTVIDGVYHTHTEKGKVYTGVHLCK